MKPYPYQRNCLNALGAARKKGRKRALTVMATGLGKTVVSAFEIKRLLKQAPGRVLYLCHSNHILRQARKTFEEVLGGSYTHGYFHGTEKHLHHVDVLYGSLQTMYKQRKKFKRREFRYVVVDEVHHAHAATFRPTIEYFQPDWMIGLTATPERGDGLDISTLFEGPPVFELGIFKALAKRHLCDVDYRIMTDEIQKLEVLDTPVGKLSIAELNRTVFVPKRDKEIARIIQQKAAEEFENPRVMIFCASIEHAERMAKLMPHAVIVHSKLKTKEKDERLDAFRSGKVSTILTVDMLNEGIDVPEANVIVFLRSTASRRIFLQQLGRGLRKALGKLKVLVLDFVANCERITMIDQLQQGVREALNSLPSGPKAIGEAGEAQSAFTLTLDGLKFEERVWRLFQVIDGIKEGYTRDELTAQLLRKVAEMGRAPTSKEVDTDPNMASLPSFTKIFDRNWNDILRLHGFNIHRVAKHDSSVLAIQLFNKAQALGRAPSSHEVNQDPTMPASTVFQNAFGPTWDEVLAAVGLSRLDDDQTLRLTPLLRARAAKLGRIPTRKEVVEDPDLPHPDTIRKVFKATWEGVFEKIGIAPSRQLGLAELRTQLFEKAQKLGRPPTTKEVDADPEMVSSRNLRDRLEMSWPEILKSIFGVEKKEQRRDYTREELAGQLLAKANLLNRTPTSKEVKLDLNMADPRSFLKVFDVESWPDVTIAVGLSPTRKSPKAKR